MCMRTHVHAILFDYIHGTICAQSHSDLIDFDSDCVCGPWECIHYYLPDIWVTTGIQAGQICCLDDVDQSVFEDQ